MNYHREFQQSIVNMQIQWESRTGGHAGLFWMTLNHITGTMDTVWTQYGNSWLQVPSTPKIEK